MIKNSISQFFAFPKINMSLHFTLSLLEKNFRTFYSEVTLRASVIIISDV